MIQMTNVVILYVRNYNTNSFKKKKRSLVKKIISWKTCEHMKNIYKSYVAGINYLLAAWSICQINSCQLVDYVQGKNVDVHFFITPSVAIIVVVLCDAAQNTMRAPIMREGFTTGTDYRLFYFTLFISLFMNNGLFFFCNAVQIKVSPQWKYFDNV